MARWKLYRYFAFYNFCACLVSKIGSSGGGERKPPGLICFNSSERNDEISAGKLHRSYPINGIITSSDLAFSFSQGDEYPKDSLVSSSSL